MLPVISFTPCRSGYFMPWRSGDISRWLIEDRLVENP